MGARSVCGGGGASSIARVRRWSQAVSISSDSPSPTTSPRFVCPQPPGRRSHAWQPAPTSCTVVVMRASRRWRVGRASIARRGRAIRGSGPLRSGHRWGQPQRAVASSVREIDRVLSAEQRVSVAVDHQKRDRDLPVHVPQRQRVEFAREVERAARTGDVGERLEDDLRGPERGSEAVVRRRAARPRTGALCWSPPSAPPSSHRSWCRRTPSGWRQRAGARRRARSPGGRSPPKRSTSAACTRSCRASRP